MKNSRPLPLAAAAECARLCFTAAAAPAGVRSVSRVVLNSISRACVIAGCVGPTFVHSDRRPRAWGSGGCSRCVEQHQGSGECAHWGFLSARCVEQQQLSRLCGCFSQQQQLKQQSMARPRSPHHKALGQRQLVVPPECGG